MATFREATLDDIPGMAAVRFAVKENVLSNPELVTTEDYNEYLTMRGKGWISEIDGQVVGFSIVDLVDNNIWALFVHPDFEASGIGSKLHDRMMDWYFLNTEKEVWLGTDPNTRAFEFYKRKGWNHVGKHGDKEAKFTMSKQEWLERDR